MAKRSEELQGEIISDAASVARPDLGSPQNVNEPTQPQSMDSMDQTSQSVDPVQGVGNTGGQAPPPQQPAPPPGDPNDPFSRENLDRLMEMEPDRGENDPERDAVPRYLGGPGYSTEARREGAEYYQRVMRGEEGEEAAAEFFSNIGRDGVAMGGGRGLSIDAFLRRERLESRGQMRTQNQLAEMNAEDDAERVRRETQFQEELDRDIAADAPAPAPAPVPEFLARPEDQPQGEQPDNFVEMTPQQLEERDAAEAQKVKDDRQAQADENKRRSDALAMERSRKRRGLPPRDPEARAAVDGGGDGMRAYRDAPMPGQAGDQQPAQEGQAAAAATQPPEGGYKTGQTVQLQNMPGGQESTKVYSLGGGIALPDGQGMSNQDFLAAYEQLNPGKSPIDAIQGLSREPGPRGNAARKLLKDVGATGGAALTEQQQQQIQEQLGDRAGALLRGHAQDMASGISRAAQGLERDETKAAEGLRGEAQDIRRDVYAKAQKAFEADESGKSFEEIFDQTMESELSRRQYEQGEALDPKLLEAVSGQFAPPTPERAARDIDYEPVDVNQLVVRPESVPYDALGDQGFINPDTGQLGYKVAGDAGEMEFPAAYHNGKVVPVISRPDQTSLLPAGTPYILGDKYMFKGTPGRPSTTASGGTSTAGTSRGRTAGKSDEQTAQEEMADIRSDLQRQREKDFAAKSSGLLDQQESLKERLANPAITDPQDRENLQQQLTAVEIQLQAAREEANLDGPITNEDIMAEYKIRQDAKASDLQLAQDLLFETGNPAEFDARGRRSLPEDVQLTASAGGTTAQIGGREVPVTMVGDTPVVNPSTVDDIAAVESNARGNVFVQSMGDDQIGIVGGEQYKQTSQARLDLTEMAEKDQYAMFTSPEETIGKLDEYVSAKYPDLEPAEKEVVMEAVARSVGLAMEQESRESVMQRREEAGFGEVYDGAARQREAMNSVTAGVSPEVVLQQYRQGPSTNILGARRDEHEDAYNAYQQGIEDFADRAYTLANEKAFEELPKTMPIGERLEIAREAGTEAAINARGEFRAYARENDIPTNTDELNALKGRVVEVRETADEGFVASQLRSRQEAKQKQLETDRENNMREATRGAFFGQ